MSSCGFPVMAGVGQPGRAAGREWVRYAGRVVAVRPGPWLTPVEGPS
jgi:hypothetical protein